MPKAPAIDLDFDDGPPLDEPDFAAREERRVVPVRHVVRGGMFGREMPHSLEAEEYLLSCGFLDAKAVGRATVAGVVPKSFFATANQIIFDAQQHVAETHGDASVALVADYLKRRGLLATVGGFAYLTQVSSRIPTSAEEAHFIERVRDLATKRELIEWLGSRVEAAFDENSSAREIAAEMEARGSSLLRASQGKYIPHARPITAFEYPAGDDPNILLGSDDYLGRGGGMLLVSHAGAGKSSFIMDACQTWAIGEPWMGIRCNGPLKCLIIQSEDSDRYIGKIHASFAFIKRLTSEQRGQLAQNCVVASVRGVSGPSFFAELRRLVAEHSPDIVVINPAYLYAEGDIGRSEFAQPFLVGLDAVNAESKFGYIVVHHTGKPAAKDGKGKRAELEDWETVYMGFGSSYFANWPRCSALIEPRQGQPGKYWLKLGKAGVNAGVLKAVEHQASTRYEPVTKIAMRHCAQRMKVGDRERPVIYWEPDDEALDEPKATEESGPRRSAEAGRKSTHSFGDFQELWPVGIEKALPYKQLHRHLQHKGAISEGALTRLLKASEREGLIKYEAGRGYYIP